MVHHLQYCWERYTAYGLFLCAEMLIEKKILFLLSLWILLSTVCWSQRRSNPFEILPRLDSVRQAEEKSGVSQTTSVMVSDTTSLSESSEVAEFETNETETEEKKLNLTDPRYNPFEVDHVPIRKTKLSELEKKVDLSTAIVSSTAKSNNFLIWFLLISAALLAIVINSRQNILSVVYRSVFNENMLKLFQREEQQKQSTYTVLLYLIFAINAATFLYLTLTQFSELRGLKVWVAILLLVILVYVVRHLSLHLLGQLFKIEKSTGLYSFTVMIINFAAGLILIPFNLLIAFGPDKIATVMLYTAVTIIIIFVVLRIIRGIFIATEYVNERLFQIFIYLCAFEIAPVLILVKTAVKILH